MSTWRRRLNSAMNVCRLFGLGLEPNGAVAAAVDALLVLANLSYSVYGYVHVTSVVQQRMPLIWDVTTVMSVAKVYTYLLTPPVMMVAWQYNKRSLTDVVRGLDLSVTDVATAMPLARYSATWLGMSILIEYFGYAMFHVDTDFVYFSTAEYVMIAVYNVWSKVPLLVYAFLMNTIRVAVRDVNDRLATVAVWRTYRGRWGDLRQTAVRLTRDHFGVTIVAFVVCTIAEIVFYVFSVYLMGYKIHHQDLLQISVYLVNALFSDSWLFEVVRTSQNCKLELLKTQKVLNSININFNSDYKEIKYASLYMLHADFNFMPCNIFEMNYRSLRSIATLISAFLIFQIQMKLS